MKILKIFLSKFKSPKNRLTCQGCEEGQMAWAYIQQLEIGCAEIINGMEKRRRRGK